jgi:ATPase involved in DNA repair
MIEDIRKLRAEAEQRRGQQMLLQNRLAALQKETTALTKEVVCYEEAQKIIQEVAQLTQAELTYHLGELVTLAMAAVFDDPYELELEFVQRRGRTEADIWFVRDGKRVHPLSASGGGAVDVAAFALRVSLWSLQAPRSRPTLLLDEPLHFLKGNDLPEKGARMIKELSERLGVQVIMISHIPDQIAGADKRVEVVLKKGVSHARAN